MDKKCVLIDVRRYLALQRIFRHCNH